MFAGVGFMLLDGLCFWRPPSELIKILEKKSSRNYKAYLKIKAPGTICSNYPFFRVLVIVKMVVRGRGSMLKSPFLDNY